MMHGYFNKAEFRVLELSVETPFLHHSVVCYAAIYNVLTILSGEFIALKYMSEPALQPGQYH